MASQSVSCNAQPDDELSLAEYVAALMFGCVVALAGLALVWQHLVRPRIWITPKA